MSAKLSSIDRDTLAAVTGGIINTILDHKPGTDWGKVAQAAYGGAADVGPASSTAGLAPDKYRPKLLEGGIMAAGAYGRGVNEYLAQQKKLK